MFVAVEDDRRACSWLSWITEDLPALSCQWYNSYNKFL